MLFTVFSLLELFFSRCIVVAVARENLEQISPVETMSLIKYSSILENCLVSL